MFRSFDKLFVISFLLINMIVLFSGDRFRRNFWIRVRFFFFVVIMMFCFIVWIVTRFRVSI